MVDAPVTKSAVEVRACRFGYDRDLVLDGVDLTVREGEAVALAGPNGAGKTTLLKLITGLLRPSAGEVRVAGRDPFKTPARAFARQVAVVPQDNEFHFPYTVRDVVRMGRMPYLGFWGFEEDHDLDEAERMLAFCDLTHLKHRVISQVSGGERQRAVIARALAQSPRILVLDEPMRSLDIRHTGEVLDILTRIRAECALTVVMVSHDLNTVAGAVDRLVLMKDGRVVGDGTPAEVMRPDVLRETFGVEVEVLTASGGRPVVVAGIGEQSSVNGEL
jgi:iron complex transport system ATP-binding protein